MNINTLISFSFLVLIIFILSAFSGYKYAEMKFSDQIPEKTIKYDTTYITYSLPADTIQEVKIIPQIKFKEIVDSTEIFRLLDTIDNLYKRLYNLEVKQVAVLDTIFPKGDSLYLEFDKVADIFAPIYLRRASFEVPYQIQTIYVPCPKTHSIWVDVGIGVGSLGLGYLIGNVNAR